MMIKIARNLGLLAVLVGVGACSSAEKPVDIGDSRTGEKLADYAAHWEGYVEAHQFDDGSDKVRLTLDAMGNGTLEIGDSPALPLATNPDLGYPSGFDPLHRNIQDLFAGVSYSVSGATVESARIRFSINPWDLERDWCALQTSYVQAPGSQSDYLCVQFSGGSATPIANGELTDCNVNNGVVVIPVDCAKRQLCMWRVCDCGPQGCTQHEDPTAQEGYTQFDAALDATGDTLIGTLKVNDTPITVRLHRL